MRCPPVTTAVLLFLTVVSGTVEAQVLGPLRWQLLPFCNVVTLTITPHGAQYGLQGTDDQCGGAAIPAGVVGLAYPRPDGDIGMSLTTVLAPAATPVHVDVALSVSTLGGTWRDSSGNSGTFAFTPGAAAPGTIRPLSPSGLRPGSVTEQDLASSSVTSSHLATGAINRSSLIAANTIELSDLRQQTVAGVGIGITLPANGCVPRESPGFSAVKEGDLLLTSIQSGTAGVFLLPTIASADGRISYVLCNSVNAATTASVSFTVKRVPR